MTQALVIGTGPAGLMAAEVLASEGLSVTIAEAMPSPARKFLMAGKSGLNLTKDVPLSDVLAQVSPLSPTLRMSLEAFGPKEVKAFATGLGQTIFTGSSGRVFPTSMKASPMLRAWLARLDSLGVRLERRWTWRGFCGPSMVFDTPEGETKVTPVATVLALGGASWPRLGSTGAWQSQFDPHDIAPFTPANAGVSISWSSHMERFLGVPVKGVTLWAGTERSRGDVVITGNGLEGGGIYPLSPAIRTGVALKMDLLPEIPLAGIEAKLAAPFGKATVASVLRKRLKLSKVKWALLNECARPLPANIAPLLKALPIPHKGLMPLDGAISSAGGLRFDALDDRLMLRKRPGVFACGEMLDWEAPTGGYLLTTCLATGAFAGQSAARFARDTLAAVR